MDQQARLLIAAGILAALLLYFLVWLFLMYRQGKIEQNPYMALLKKEEWVIRHAFFNWKLKVPEEGLSFSYHKHSSYFWLFLALVHEQLIEMVVFHFWFKSEAPELAVFLLIVHVYSVLYILGDYNLLRNTPIRVNEKTVSIKIGARRQVSFPISEIESIQPSRVTYNTSGGINHEEAVFHAGAMPVVLTKMLGVRDEAKYEIVLKQPLYGEGYYGQKKEFRKVIFYMDQPDEFIELLREKMANCQPKEVVN